ncbi:MAG: F0F1 ATP synthase subunit A, partial [Planctomycetota bacterium]
FHHVSDGTVIELPRFLVAEGHWELPSFFGFQPTKFMWLQLVAFLLTFVIFVPLGSKVRKGAPVKGRFWNFWEQLCVALRDQVVRPTIGDGHHGHDDHGESHADAMGEVADMHGAGSHDHDHDVGHPADKHLPLVWSLFFFILFCNLLGAVPYLGSPTGHMAVTCVLAVVVFAYVVREGIDATGGTVPFLQSLVPTMELPGWIRPVLIPLIWVIEAFGFLVKHFVLAVRLFANLLAGHMVIGAILGFITVGAQLGPTLSGTITAASVGGQVFIGLLELFVAFLQAYVFAFLATLFISSAAHPH